LSNKEISWDSVVSLISAYQESQATPAWASTISLIEMLRTEQKPLREELKELVLRSSELLHPLAEPLLAPTPLTKMLADAREETYSDWLAWSFQVVDELSGVLRILGLPELVVTEQSAAILEFRREHPVPSGHPGQSGRLDIRILVHGEPFADIEVKRGVADHSDTAKQEGYAQWGAPHRILIASSGTKDVYEGDFNLRTWEKVCGAIRHEASRMIAKHSAGSTNVLCAGQILMFAAAVEESLLNFAGDRIRAVVNKNAPLILEKTGAELQQLRQRTREQERND
jgi:hypothetical protein